MQDAEEKLLRDLCAFAEGVIPRCPPNIDPHHFGSLLAAYQYLEIAREVRAIAGAGAVLDWGAGFGHVTYLLARLGARVTAYDVTPEFRNIGTGLFDAAALELVLGAPADPLPFAEGSVDVALSVGTLEHVADEPRSLAELGRVIRPGGRLLVYHLPNRGSWIEALARRSGRFHHDRTYTPSSVATLLAHHGFDVDRVAPYHFLPRSSFSRNRRLRRVADRNYAAFERLDGLLSRTFPLSLLATALTVHATRRP